MSVIDLELSRRYCVRLAREHPENFFVGSLFMKSDLRQDLAAVYAYARLADDFADGDFPPKAKLEILDAWERRLDDALEGVAAHPVFVALADVVRRRELPVAALRNLLVAFRRDAEFQPFPTFEDVRDYCRHSADPVGRLVLALFGLHDESLARLSDSICTALQLTNFWQDLGRDLARGRLYLPLEDLERFGVSRTDVEAGCDWPELHELVRFEVERTRALFHEGLPLADRVPGAVGREVRMFASGGLTILDRIEAEGFAPLAHRPVLRKRDKLRLLAVGLVGA